jgi:hypothetical protein
MKPRECKHLSVTKKFWHIVDLIYYYHAKAYWFILTAVYEGWIKREFKPNIINHQNFDILLKSRQRKGYFINDLFDLAH